jgi:hypothetical protein
VGIPKGFPKSVGRVGSRLHGFPCFPYSVISMACSSHGKCRLNRYAATQCDMPHSLRDAHWYSSLVIECIGEWLLKNSSTENSRKIHRARMPYKRFSRTRETFSITGIEAVCAENEFFNGHAILHQPTTECEPCSAGITAQTCCAENYPRSWDRHLMGILHAGLRLLIQSCAQKSERLHCGKRDLRGWVMQRCQQSVDRGHSHLVRRRSVGLDL